MRVLDPRTSGPELSVILVTPESYAPLRPTVRHLHAQGVRDRLELVIVAPNHAGLRIEDPRLDDFLTGSLSNGDHRPPGTDAPEGRHDAAP